MDFEEDENIRDIGTKGHTYDDTEIFDDAELLEDCEDVRIIKIRVWYDESIHGIQSVYETSNNGIIETPLRMSPDLNRYKLKYQEETFNRKEFIVGISGMHGNLVDYFVVKTNQGREILFGETGGGDEEFDFEIPEGHYAAFLKGGFGGHIHHIGCYSTEIKCPLEFQYAYAAGDSLEYSKTQGPTHDDTTVYSDIETLKRHQGQHRITELGVYYRSEGVVGLRVKYEETGKEITTKAVSTEWIRGEDEFDKITLEPGDFISNISGFSGAFFDKLVITTVKGEVYTYGDDRDDNFDFEIPDGMIISGIEPGIGGHLHNLTVHYGPIPKVFMFDEPEHSESKYSLCRYRTDTFGQTHDDTEEFDDWDKIDKSKIRSRITKLYVYYDDEHVFGFQTTWDVAGKKVKGGKYRGSSYETDNPQKAKIKLSAGEYITRVYGRAGIRIDQICFETSEGDVYEFGYADGGDEFDAGIPPGYAVGALTGGTNGHLHNLTVWFGKINKAGQGLPMVQYYTLENRFPNDFTCGGTHGDTEEFSDEGTLNNCF